MKYVLLDLVDWILKHIWERIPFGYEMYDFVLKVEKKHWQNLIDKGVQRMKWYDVALAVIGISVGIAAYVLGKIYGDSIAHSVALIWAGKTLILIPLVYIIWNMDWLKRR